MLVVLWLTLTCYIYLPVFILIKFCTFIKLRDSRQSHCQITKWFLRHFALQRSKCNPVACVVSSWSRCIHTKSWYHKIVSLIRGSLSGMCSIFVMQAWTFSFAELHHILSWRYQQHCGIFTFFLFLSCFSTRLYFFSILSKKLRVANTSRYFWKCEILMDHIRSLPSFNKMPNIFDKFFVCFLLVVFLCVLMFYCIDLLSLCGLYFRLLYTSS